MGISNAEHVAVLVVVGLLVDDLEQAEVPVAFLGHGVALVDCPHAGGRQSGLDLLDHTDVWDRAPRGGRRWGGNINELLAFDFGRAAVEDQVCLFHTVFLLVVTFN